MLRLNLDKKQKNIIKGLIVFLLFFISNYIMYVPFWLFKIDISEMNIWIKQIYMLFFQLVHIYLIYYLYKEELKNKFIEFKKNYKGFFKDNIKYWLFALAIMYASNIVIGILKYRMTGDVSSSANEEAIRSTLTQAPLYTFIAAAVLAPIIEELTFRKSLRHIFSNKIIFVIISSFIFGGLHVFNADTTLFDLLYLIPYCAPGVAFAIILVKTDNIFNTISLHFIHNTILMTLQIVMLVRGII